MLLKLVDASGDDPAGAWKTVRDEMAVYGEGLTDKAEILALSRSDLADEKKIAKAKKTLAKAGAPNPIVISASSGEGIGTLLDAIIERLGPEPETAEPDEPEGRAWSPL